MSANHSLLLFEGDVTPLLPAIFDNFGFKTTGNIEYAKGLAEIWELTNWPRKSRPHNYVHKGVLFNGTWTAILDRGMTMILDQEKCERCASTWGIKVFGYLIESVSGTCALYLYAPNKVRGLNIQNFEVLEDFGEPLPQETGITNEEMLADGTMRISRRLGFSDSLFAHPTSRVQILEMEDPARTAELERMTTRTQTHTQTHTGTHSRRTPPPSGKKPETRLEKPWWKLW
jgi:hypothetical protein